MRIVKFLLFLICSLFVRVDVYAYDFKVNGLCYNKLSDSTVEVTWEDINKPYTGDVVVPSYVNYIGKRYDVVAIGDCAMVSVQSVRQNEVYGWKDNHEINSVSLPSTILSIGRAAFDGCSGLFSITIPNSVTNIGRQAFSRCIGLISIIIPSSVTSIASSAFNMCSGLITIRVESGNTMYDSRNGCNAIIETSTNSLIQGCKNTTIPNSVTSIGSYAFDECTSLTSINIPNSLTSIGSCAFRGCSSLTSINIPNSVTTIEEDAFSGCNGLSSLTIPNSVTDIGRSAFSNCDGLNSIKVESSNKKYDSRNGCNAIIETATSTLMVGCKNTIIPISVTSIGYGAFKGCINLTSITIPNSVMSIGGFAFSGCSGLTSLTIPSSVTNIDESAFSSCSGLSSLTIPNSVAIISRSAFRNCIGLTSITIPNSVASIGDMAFANCSNLTSVVSEIVSPFEISSDVFSDYSRLTLTVPRGTKSKYQTTNYWNKFTNIVEASGGDTSTKRTIHVATAGTLPNLISESEKYTIEELTLTGELNGTDFRLLRDMAGCNYLGERTEGKLSVLDMSGAKIVAGGEKYLDTKSISTSSTQSLGFDFRFDLQRSNEIGQFLFCGCNIVSVLLPNETTSIGKHAFRQCYNLHAVSIPDKVTNIDEWAFLYCTSLTSITIPNSVTSIGRSVFYGCSGLTSIKVGTGNIKYDSRNSCNAIIETATNTLFFGCKKTTIPNSVTSIGNFAFSGCNDLTSITIPNSVTEIGNYAFSDCSDLTSLTIPNSVTSIGSSAFYDCGGLTLLTIPNSVIIIGSNAFEGCSGLTSIAIPNSVILIGSNAFSRCRGLTSIKVASGNTKYDSRNSSDAIIETATNTLISGCKNTTIPNSVTSIGSSAFSGCNGLASITIPNSVVYIGSGAFYNCINLASVVSEIVNPFEISENVFRNIASNATLTVPSGTKSKYQATNYWNKFTNIVEANEGSPTTEVTFTSNQITYRGIVSSRTAEVKSVNAGVTDLEIPSSVSYDGTTYQVTSIADDALSNRTFNYVSLPSTVKSISSSTFYNSKLGALIWNASASLSQSVFSNMGMPVNSNFLLYVNSTSYAPSNVKNVVINSSAQTILLSDDGGDFYCPKAFTAQSISYTHNYSMTTGGSGKGWETLALPFDVQKIGHKTKGSLTPFALYDTNSSSQRPFWLYELGSNGFRRSEGIKANTPYIISMPNSTSYDSEYILTGDVTFSASSVQVRASNSVTAPVSGSKRFVPAFSSVARSSSVYALNVSNQKVSNSSSYDSGSRFISNLRSVYPFEAYMTTSSSGARMLNIGIEFEDDATDIDIIPSANGEQGVVKVYSLNGTLVLKTDRESLQKQWEPLPAGIYIVNGKKMVK